MNSAVSPASDPNRRKNWFNRYTVGVGAVAVLAAGGYFGWKHFRGKRTELDQYQIVTVQRADIEDLVTATGSLQPREYVDVGAQVSGQLKKIHVEIGSVVRAGDLLAEIDPTVFLANVDARRAALRNLQATMLDRQAQLALAQQQRERQRNLMAGEATTSEAVQQAEAALKAANAQVEALKAQIEQSESTLRADEANLNYANIYSPIAGVVVSITARQGQTINANQQAPILLRVADLSTMTVQTQVSEADIAQLHPNMDAYFTTLGNRGRKWWGNLRKVEPTPTVTNNVVLYNALFDVENDQRNLLPQMTAQVFFVSASVQDALVVPASAVTIQRQPRERAGAGRGEGAGPGASGAARGDGRGEGRAASGMASSASGSGRGDASRQRASGLVKGDGAQASADAASRGGDRGEGRARREAGGPQGGAGMGGNGGPGGMNGMANMSPEERRAMFERMSPEEREAFREKRRAMREQMEGQGGQGGGARRGEGANGDRPMMPAAVADASSSATTTATARRSGNGTNASAPAKNATKNAQPSLTPVWAGVGPGRAQRARDGVVKVVTEDGRIEERKVKVGISNRVQVQILEGLKEGEKVVAGMKAPPPRDGAGNNRQQGQGGQGQGQGQGGLGGLGAGGNLGGGMGNGGAGGGRGR